MHHKLLPSHRFNGIVLHGTASGPPIGQPAPPLLRAPIGEDAGSEFRIEGDVVDRVALDGVERPAEYRIDGLHHTYDLDVRSFVVPPKFVRCRSWRRPRPLSFPPRPQPSRPSCDRSNASRIAPPRPAPGAIRLSGANRASR